MGVINTTPDSFSDGGKFYNLEKAFAGAQQMIAAGADPMFLKKDQKGRIEVTRLIARIVNYIISDF